MNLESVNLVFGASVGDTITDAVAEVAKALRYPVLILALLALLVVAYELGRLAIEAWKRSQRPKTPFEQTARHAIAQSRAGDTAGAQATLLTYAYSKQLQKAAVNTLFAPDPIDAQRAVIDYDLYVSKRLDRVRLMVRAGPALGLMGTLIPLAPALSALGEGNPKVLADELQTAFAITVVGVMVGLVAFTVALFHERYFTKDLADLEFLREVRGDANTATPATAPSPATTPAHHQSATDRPAAESAVTAAPVSAKPQSAAQPAQPKNDPGATQPSAPAIPATGPAANPVAPGITPAAPAVPGLPPLPPEPPKKKKFGISKKQKPQAAPPATPGAPAFPPPPPAPAQPDAQTQVSDKAPSIPDAPEGDKK